jgi:hypothetical protein
MLKHILTNWWRLGVDCTTVLGNITSHTAAGALCGWCLPSRFVQDLFVRVSVCGSVLVWVYTRAVG